MYELKDLKFGDVVEFYFGKNRQLGQIVSIDGENCIYVHEKTFDGNMLYNTTQWKLSIDMISDIYAKKDLSLDNIQFYTFYFDKNGNIEKNGFKLFNSIQQTIYYARGLDVENAKSVFIGVRLDSDLVLDVDIYNMKSKKFMDFSFSPLVYLSEISHNALKMIEYYIE